MKFKRFFALALAALLVMSLFAGCSKNSDTPGSKTDSSGCTGTVWRNSCVRKYSMFLLIIQNGYSQHIPVPNAKERLRIFRIRSVF